MNDLQKISNKKPWLIALVVIVLLFLLMAVQLYRTNPDRTMNQFITAIENGDQGAAMKLVSDSIPTERRENVAWFVDDWTSAEKTATELTADAAWRQRVVMEKGENGDDVPVKNQYGDRLQEIVPTTRYLAGMYRADVVVNYDEDEDPVVITLRRKGGNRWSYFSTALRGWEIVRIQYQESEDDEQGVEDGEVYEFEGTEDVDFEIDEEGNVVIKEPAEKKKEQPAQ